MRLSLRRIISNESFEFRLRLIHQSQNPRVPVNPVETQSPLPETKDLIYFLLSVSSLRSPFHLPRFFLTDRLSLTNSGIPTFEEQVSRHLILSRLRTLKTTIE